MHHLLLTPVRTTPVYAHGRSPISTASNHDIFASTSPRARVARPQPFPQRVDSPPATSQGTSTEPVEALYASRRTPQPIAGHDWRISMGSAFGISDASTRHGLDSHRPFLWDFRNGAPCRSGTRPRAHAQTPAKSPGQHAPKSSKCRKERWFLSGVRRASAPDPSVRPVIHRVPLELPDCAA